MLVDNPSQLFPNTPESVPIEGLSQAFVFVIPGSVHVPSAKSHNVVISYAVCFKADSGDIFHL